jgi:putative membrane protein
MMTGRYIGHGMYGDGISILFMFIFFSVLIIATVYFLVRRAQISHTPSLSQPQHYQQKTVDPAEAILRERYARGEVSDEEYEQKLSKLRGEKPEKDHEENGIQ